MSFTKTASDAIAPTETPLGDRAPYERDAIEYNHPAFGQISFSRVHGGHQTLYASDFVHNTCVRMKINKSKLTRNLARDWHFAGEELIEVDLSESQFVTLISTLNQGSGIPCTLRRVGREKVPDITPRNEDNAYKNDLRTALQAPLDHLRELEKKLALGITTKTGQNALREEVRSAIAKLTSTLPFVADCFDEHVEAKIEKAKVEIEGHMTGRLMAMGIEASRTNRPFELEAKNEEDHA